MQIIAHTDRVEGSNLDRCNDKDSDWANCSIHFEDARPRCPSLPISIAQIGLTVPLDAAAKSLAIAHNASERLRRGSSFLENFSLSERLQSSHWFSRRRRTVRIRTVRFEPLPTAIAAALLMGYPETKEHCICSGSDR